MKNEDKKPGTQNGSEKNTPKADKVKPNSKKLNSDKKADISDLNEAKPLEESQDSKNQKEINSVDNISPKDSKTTELKDKNSIDENSQEKNSLEDKESQVEFIPTISETDETDEKQQNGLKKMLSSQKFKRSGMATIMTVVFIVLIIGVNMVSSLLTDRFPSLNIDLTAEKLNTLSEQAVNIAKQIKNPTEIIILASEDKARKDQVLSTSNVKYSQVSNLADKLQESNSKIAVTYMDPDSNPTFIQEYADDALTTGKVLVRTEKRYKVLAIADLYNVTQDKETGAYQYFSKVDSALANAINMVNLDTVPVVAMAAGHNEMLNLENRSALEKLLTDRSFVVQEINFLTEEIPDETRILFLPTPATDYTKEEVDKMRAFLSNSANEFSKSVILTSYPTQSDLPNLSEFLEEWGMKIEPGIVVETDTANVFYTDPSFIFAKASEDFLAEKQYSQIVSPYSSPITLLFSGNDDIGTKKLWTSSNTAYAALEEAEENPETDEYILAAMGTKIEKIGDKHISQYVAVFGSTLAFSNDFSSNATFGNKSYFTDLFQTLTEMDDANTGIYTEEVETGKMDIAMSQTAIIFIGLVLFTILIPLAVLITGLVVFLKRRHM